MKSSHKKLLGLLLLLLFLVPLGMAIKKVYRELRQPELNRALIASVKQNDTAAVVSLLREGADSNARDLPPDTRSLWLRLWDRLRGKPIPTGGETTALLLAVSNRDRSGNLQENIPMVQALLDRGADVNARGNCGITALMAAVAADHLATVALLIDRGADVNLKMDADFSFLGIHGSEWRSGFPGETALQYAFGAGNMQTIRLLMKHGADVNVRDYEGKTLLMRTLDQRSAGQARFLLANGADVNAATPDGTTALMLARSEMISLLYKQGAGINARDNNGWTALMYSAKAGDDDKLRLLLKLGADAGVKSKTGKTALNLAERRLPTNSIRLLKQAGGKTR